MSNLRNVGLVAVLSLAASGCATSLSATHQAKVLKKGDWEVTGGLGMNLPVGAIWKVGKEVFDAGKDAADRIASGERTADQVKADEATALRAAKAAAFLVAQPPSFSVPEITVRYGIWDRFDIGVRYSGPAFRAEATGQILEGAGAGWDLAAQLGYAHHSFGGTVLDFLDKLKLASFSRHDIDATLLFGRMWKYGGFYAGPKFQFQRYGAEGMLIKDGENESKVVIDGPTGTLVEAKLDLGNGLVYGGLAGFRVGYKYVYLTGELGVFGSSFKPVILDDEYDLGGLILYPAIGLVATW